MKEARLDPMSNRWLLPEAVDEFLPPQAEGLERLRRELLDVFFSWGYELVMPPLIEYIESLLVGNDLDLETFKLVDQSTGRLLGLRPDITPQAARIDAHRLSREGPTRLCYLDPVVRARRDGFASSRNPLQVGAELFGHAGIESDIEILRLMVRTLRVAGLGHFHIDLGHVGIFRALAREAGLDATQESVLFEALQRKARPEIEAYLGGLAIDADSRRRLVALVELNGGEGVLDEAGSALRGAGQGVMAALDSLRQMAAAAQCQLATIELHYDLAELRGYRYQSGVVFAAYAPAHGWEIARGGRYDDIGRFFGRRRPATGFSTDLKTLLTLGGSVPGRAKGILAPPWSDDDELRRLIRRLRAEGERVIYTLPGQAADLADLDCDRRIERRDGTWAVTAAGS